MEYVAIAFEEKNDSSFVSKLFKEANNHGIVLKYDNDCQIDTEISSGLKTFCKWNNISEILFLNYPSIGDTSQVSSGGISQDLREFNFGKKSDSILLNFLNEPIIINKNYYLIFAFEWEEKDMIRFVETNINGVEKYFRENVSWYLWLYIYQVEQPYYFCDLDVPIVFKVNNIIDTGDAGVPRVFP